MSFRKDLLGDTPYQTVSKVDEWVLLATMMRAKYDTLAEEGFMVSSEEVYEDMMTVVKALSESVRELLRP